MSAFSRMPSGFPVKKWDIYLCFYDYKQNKYVLLPPKISLSLPQYSLVSKQQGALRLVYTNLRKTRETKLLFYDRERALIFFYG